MPINRKLVGVLGVAKKKRVLYREKISLVLVNALRDQLHVPFTRTIALQEKPP